MTRFLLLLMSVIAQTPMVTDGDETFFKVDTFRPSHKLEPGVAAEAVNKRFEDGRAWPRHGVNNQPWGRPNANLAAGTWPLVTPGALTRVDLTLVVGTRYRYVVGNSALLTDDFTPNLPASPQPGGNNIAEGGGTFVATQASYYLWGAHALIGETITAQIVQSSQPRGFARFNDPNGFDNLIELVDDWRNGVGEDGGRGRAWRVISGNAPQEIDLNGHDIWDTCRLIPCYNGLVLLRQGNERHYFSAAAVDIANDCIQLNTPPAWANGDLVFFHADPDSYITGASPPNPETTYYVKNIGANLDKVELYTDGGLTTKLDFNGGVALGTFYLERRATNPGFFGNGAPPLIIQPDGTGATAFEVGFKAVPAQVLATAFDGTSKILSAANHRLIPGDKVIYTHTNATTETFYVNPSSPDGVRLYATLIKALAGAAADRQTPNPAQTAGDYITKDGASGLPMPPGREGCFLPCGRLLIVNGDNSLAISDPLDPLHFAPYSATLNANLGESDKVTSVIPLGNDTNGKDITLIGKENVILKLTGLAGPSSDWELKEVTREYGFGASLATVIAGRDCWGFGRKGVLSVEQTEAGVVSGVALPVSWPMKKYLDQIDWRFFRQAASATWNNRYFIAVPLKGQASGPDDTVKNNGILVYNFLTGGWEGLWQGDSLEVYAWARHYVYGEERLTFVDYDGQVCWLGDGWTDPGAAPISDLLVTRTYTKGTQIPKLWLSGQVIYDSQNPKLSITARAPGYNEEEVLLSGKEFDPTQYLQYGQSDYDPDTGENFDLPGREDYSLSPGEVVDGPLDAHQNIVEPVRMRLNDWGVQLAIENTQGSVRVQSVELSFVPLQRVSSRRA